MMSYTTTVFLLGASVGWVVPVLLSTSMAVATSWMLGGRQAPKERISREELLRSIREIVDNH